MQEPNIEELLNKIELLKQALNFYAEEKNYSGENPMILKDSGHQAKFALSQLEKIDLFNENIINDVKSVIDSVDSKINKEDSDYFQRIFKLKEILKKYGN